MYPTDAEHQSWSNLYPYKLRDGIRVPLEAQGLYKADFSCNFIAHYNREAVLCETRERLAAESLTLRSKTFVSSDVKLKGKHDSMYLAIGYVYQLK